MLKFLSIFVSLLMLCFVFCGCGAEDSVSDMASEAMSSVESDAKEMMDGNDGTVADGDGMIGNETTTSTDNADDSDSKTNTEDSNNTDDTSETTDLM